MNDDIERPRTPHATNPPPLHHSPPIRRAAMITVSVGIAHSVLLLLALLLVRWRMPDSSATEAEINAFYQNDNQRRAVLFAGIYLIPFAGIAYIWFVVALRMWLQGAIDGVDELLFNILLVCSIVYVSLLFCAGAALSLVSIDPTLGNNGQDLILLARPFPQYGSALFIIFATRMAAMTVFAVTNITRRSRSFPRWFIYASFVIGVSLAITSSIDPLIAMVFPAWLALFCILLIVRIRKLPVDIDLAASTSSLRQDLA